MVMRIKILMVKKNIKTVSQLARLSGVPYTTLTKVFRGENGNTKLDTLKSIRTALGCTLDYLIYGTDDNASDKHTFSSIIPSAILELWVQLDHEQQSDASDLFVGIMRGMLKHDNRKKTSQQEV